MIQSEEQNEGISISKEFLIDKIEETSRTDETTDSVILHCVEYHTFKSSIQNIMKMKLVKHCGKPITSQIE